MNIPMPWPMPWPLPALCAWAAGWLPWLALRHAGVDALPAFALAGCASGAVAWFSDSTWRRGIAAAGFPLSLLALGGVGSLPAWLWLLPLAPLLALYPLRAWRDAPVFPTPADALQGLDGIVGQPQRVLDAGCGLGHGLHALQRLWPRAALVGIEWSAPLAWAARWRCRGVDVRRGDMWQASWAGHDLVYLFQRPESMARAFAKAAAELSREAWLVSLEFAVPGVKPVACLQGPGRKPVWVYRPAADQRSTRAAPGR